MQSGTLWRVLGLCLLSVGAWGQEDDEETGTFTQRPYKVSISGTTVVVTCPQEPGSEIKWEKKGIQLQDHEDQEHLVLEDFSEMKDSGYYACYTGTSKEVSHYLYLRARVCENCMEVDVMAVATIVVVDVCVTLGLMMLVYYWSKTRKAKAKPVMRGMGAAGRPKGQSKARPPPVPNPDYEPIRKGQRDLYSGLNQRGV
ncbi:T-cell surface glycoprotein CD3 epsilon chain precursor [Daubentonia madagascariensis]|uniref:T-cell surface glycoprotein CD3 epsilon chain n=1 Tax=Daubentonia madagascariensis TaxID=31869 RepID=A0ABD2FFB6_DAUMA